VNYNNDRSRWFSQLLCFCFCLLVNLFLTSCYDIAADFVASFTGTSQTQISPQSRKADLHKYVLLVLYLSIYESNLLIFVKSILIYIFFLSSSVKQPGYGDAGNMYAAQGSGARAGAKYFKLLWLVWFGLFITLCYFLMYWRLSFFLFTVGFPQVGIFHVQLKSQFDIIEQLNIWRNYHHSFCILWKCRIRDMWWLISCFTDLSKI